MTLNMRRRNITTKPLTEGQRAALKAHQAYHLSCTYQGQYKPDKVLFDKYCAAMKQLTGAEAWRVLAIIEGRGSF